MDKQTMQALRFTAKTKTLELVDVDVPVLSSPNEVLIKIAFSGICGTDLHIMQGEFPCNPDVPVIMGHEFCGSVEKIGCKVTNFKKGDKVAVDPNRGCGRCDPCRLGQPHFCSSRGFTNSLGIWKDGGWASYCIAPVEQVYLLKDTIIFSQGALTEPLSCLAHGWDLVSPITIGKKILVMGAGIIGNLWCAVLHLNGHKDVTVSETNVKRLQLLTQLETDYKLMTSFELNKMKECDPNVAFDFIIDCTGAAKSLEQALNLVNVGGKIVIFGCAPMRDEATVKPFDIYKKELQIIGVLVNPHTFPKAIGLMEALGDRYLNYQRLGVETYELKDYQKAIAALKEGTVAKAVFKLATTPD